MKILEPIKVGQITFKNRIMFPPLTTGYEEKDGSIGERSFNFYKRLAEGGVGYIVLGDVVPARTFSPTPKLYSPEQVPAFKRLADACHEYDCKLGIQLFHPEYNVAAMNSLFAQGKFDEARAQLRHDMQHFVDEMTKEQIEDILHSMGECARLAVSAGVDCIEVHGDRLVGSLCSTILNHRTDEYGGAFENRVRFALEVVKTLRKAAPDIVIDYKLPIVTPLSEGGLRGKGGLELDEAKKLAVMLEEAGVDTLHVAQANHTGNMADTIPPMGTQNYGFTVYCAKEIKELVKIPVSCVGRVVTPMAAEAIVASGTADLVGLGRSLLADPDFVRKCEEGRPELVRCCIMCNKGCTDAIQNRQFVSCVLNAENGYEGTRKLTPAAKVRKVAVIGAGVAGLEAARVASMRGHKVTVYEKTLSIGGQIKIASVPPRKDEMRRVLSYYENILADLPVEFRFGTCPEASELNLYDEIIVAAGAQNAMPPIPGASQPQVVSAWDVLAGKSIVFGSVAVIGGGLVGAETAEFLAEKGCKVSVIEMLDAVAKEESGTILPTLMKEFTRLHVSAYVNTRLDEITADSVVVTTTEGETASTMEIPADFVVMAVGARKNTFEIEGVSASVNYVGDCGGERPSNIDHAIKSAYEIAAMI